MTDLRTTLPLTLTRELLKEAQAMMGSVRQRILAGFGTNVSATYKADGSIVTRVDLEVEEFVREHIAKQFPQHGFLGEETGNAERDSDFCWCLDPIDGTHNFAHGIPTFGSILSLSYKGLPLVGLVDHPALGLLYSAGFGLGAFCNHAPIKLDNPQDGFDPQEIVATTTRNCFEQSGLAHVFDALCASQEHIRIYYDTFAITRVAHGQVAVYIDANANPWEYPAYKILVEEAGGICARVLLPESVTERTRQPIIIGRSSAVKELVQKLHLELIDG